MYETSYPEPIFNTDLSLRKLGLMSGNAQNEPLTRLYLKNKIRYQFIQTEAGN